MRRTNQILRMVDICNQYLIENHIKEISNDVFKTVSLMLQSVGAYRSYDYYNERCQLTTRDNPDYDHLEFY